jgi:hypothetical protein
MKIEDLRGKEFTHCSEEFPIYVVGRGRDGRTIIHWKDEADTVVYRDEQVVDFFERGVWILTK